MQTRPEKSYVLCATPRTGSTLLCSLLTSTNVAGRPESYFRAQDFRLWASRWHLPDSENVDPSFAAYVPAMISAGSTSNNVFGIRIMWGSMTELVAVLNSLLPAPESDTHVIERFLGPTTFVYLSREDVVAQAVSLSLAVQTDVWHRQNEHDVTAAKQTPQYDFDAIQSTIRQIETDTDAWQRWFDKNSIDPYRITYEDLAATPEATARKLLQRLDISLPEGIMIESATQRLSNSVNAEWASRYRAQAGN